MTCQSCGSPTTNTCTRCGAYIYCNSSCQSQHWAAHKDTCKDAQLGQALALVAEILHEAYLTFRENTWDTPVNRIVSSPQTLTIYDGDQALNNTYFTAFPNHLVHNDREAKMALLTAWSCDEPYAFLHLLLVKLLQGLNINVEELDVELSNVPRSVNVVMPNGSRISNWPAYKHHLLCVRSRRSGNKEWVFDLCGAQYGIYRPFNEWVQYRTRYVQRQSGHYHSGFAKSMLARLSQLRGIPALTYGLVGWAAQAFDAATNAWEAQNIPLSQLRALKGAVFDQQKTSLLSALDEGVRAFIGTNDFTAVVRQEKQYNAQYPGEAGRCEALTDQMCRDANIS